MILQLFCSKTYTKQTSVHRLRGAMVARLTPDQMGACSSHVGVNCSFFVHLTSLCLIAQKLSAKRTPQVLRHWICCLMLSRLNSEHIFACANLLNISNSLLSQRIDCLLHVRVNFIKRIHRAQLFLHQHCGTFAKRLTQDEKVVILKIEVTC